MWANFGAVSHSMSIWERTLETDIFKAKMGIERKKDKMLQPTKRQPIKYQKKRKEGRFAQ